MDFLFFLFLLFVGGLVGIVLYFVPTIVGFMRRVPNRGSLFVVNFFLGWTLIGWVVALAMALRDPAPETVVVVHGPPQDAVADRPVYETRELEAAAEELPEDPFGNT